MRVATNGTTLNVVERGAGPLTLVFLHYFGGSALAWSGVMDRLAPTYRCVAPDLRGHGDSAAPADGYSMNDAADDVAGLIVALGIERHVLVGHSMGGKIALTLAARRFPALLSLVLLAPSPPSPEPIPTAERARLLAAHGDAAAARETAMNVTARPLTAALLAQVIGDGVHTAAVAWRAWLECGSREDLASLAGQVGAATLVVAGAHDRVLGARVLQDTVLSRLSRARMAVVPDVGHLIPLENPAAAAELIDRHCRV